MVDVVSIVAGGWSFGDVDHKKVPGTVIAVNDSMKYFTGPIQFILSMDRMWMENRWAELERMKVLTYLRRSTLKNVHWQKCNWMRPYDNDRFVTKFSDSIMQLNGQSSGNVAMNLAYLLRPKVLYLFGFDMCLSHEDEAHWYPVYPWAAHKGEKGVTGAGTYLEWAKDFDDYAQQFKAAGVKVINVSPTSRINAFEKISAGELGCAR